ncbi:helix-turn-helix domain-containing protein [Candidatus Falkowbacteria bacterium]|nr:helix-turn-helix domain-containing protein [Candidatus Falkowbacteria bacterium]
MLSEIKKSLAELGFNHNEIKVYVALTQLGEAPAAQIAKKAGLPRTTAISILAKLAEENYLTQHRYRGVTYYWVESPQAIASAFETKIKVANDLNSLLTDLYRSETHFPYAQVYDTKNSIRNFIEKFIAAQPKKSTIYTIDTPSAGNYSKIYSEQIGSSMLSKKQVRGISTRTLVPHGSIGTINPAKLAAQKIELRELPKEIDFKASFWLAQNQLVHFSGNPPFAVVIKHPLIVKSFESIYDFLWKTSRQSTQ